MLALLARMFRLGLSRVLYLCIVLAGLFPGSLSAGSCDDDTYFDVATQGYVLCSHVCDRTTQQVRVRREECDSLCPGK